MEQLELADIHLTDIDDDDATVPPFRRHLGDLGPLTGSIQRFGLVNPPVVWSNPTSGRYAIVDGHRRIAVLRQLSSTGGVTCAVFVGNAAQAREFSCVAHLGYGAYQETNHGDEIVGVLALLAAGTLGKQVPLAKALGRKQGWVSQARMIKDNLAPELFDELRDGTLSRNRALELVSPQEDGRYLDRPQQRDRRREAEASGEWLKRGRPPRPESAPRRRRPTRPRP